MDTESTATDSIRDSLSAALEQASPGGQEAPPPAQSAAEPTQEAPGATDGQETPQPTEQAPAKPGERARDVSGRFAAKGLTPAATEPAPAAAPVAAPQGPEVRAPSAWKATARERWADTPTEVQAEVAKREREITIALDQTSEARRFYGQFRELVGPFEGMLRAEGMDPLRGVQSLVQTWAALRTAPVPHRAQVLTDLIQQSGVPLQTLDEVLSARLEGRSPGAGGQSGPDYRDPRVDQLLASLQQTAQQRQAAIHQKNATEVAKFGEGREWFEDVRETMADLLEVAGKRGVEMSLEDAYNAAVSSPLHKDIAEVVKARTKPNGNTPGVSTQRARIAASSVRSQPAGASRNGAPQQNLAPFEDRKADLEAAMAEVDGR